jgi:hypothetical protein
MRATPAITAVTRATANGTPLCVAYAARAALVALGECEQV